MARAFLTEKELPRGKMLLVGRRVKDGELLACVIKSDLTADTMKEIIRAFDLNLVYGTTING